MQWNDSVVAITGGARGLGLAMAAVLGRKGALLRQKLEGLVAENPEVFEAVRGQGFMLGLKCKVAPADLVKAGYEEELITVPAADNVVRLLPALTLSEDEIAEAVERLDRTAKRVAVQG